MTIKDRIRLVKGDISSIEVDAVVNAANNHLWMGTGVAGALKRRGGQDIEDEAVRKGPISVGDVVETGAGTLPARYVIHAAVMGQDLRTNEQVIRKATRNALKLAESLGVKRVAFPALGTGVGGFPLNRCAQVMLEEVLTYPKPLDVVFVLYSEESYSIFRAVYDSL
ncbi:MAG: macro domain-containing protein [Theionarchaea archaeon]|nr:macro domain-containing protein [Theionarchaea archaeon]MBU7038440.1 macro domain-containing protein [Theionarchaea archaeon]